MHEVTGGPLAWAVVVAWYGAGVLAVAIGLFRRAYFNALPLTRNRVTRRNRRLKRASRLWFVLGVSMIAMGLWNQLAVWPSALRAVGIFLRLVVLLGGLFVAWNSRRLARRFAVDRTMTASNERDVRLMIMSAALLAVLAAARGLFNRLVLGL